MPPTCGQKVETMTRTLQHSTLNAELRGLEDDRYGPAVTHFRGIKYGSIQARFARPEAVDDLSVLAQDGTVDCRHFGPQCPQIQVDIGHMLRIPEDEVDAKVPEDEFECLNLNVTVPSNTAEHARLPVCIWIHGGSQAVTFPSAASKCGDQARIVAQSSEEGRPIIFVSFNYRLNIFAFGEEGGEKNLALKDQKLAVDWVKRHISGFGGDSDKVTVAGESAGAVYAHAQLVADKSLSGIMASGSLYLSPPIPLTMKQGMLAKVRTSLSRTCPGKTLTTAPAKALISALEENNILSFYLESDPENEALTNWQALTSELPRIMLGDVEYEASIWRNKHDSSPPAELVSAFDDTDPEYGPQLRRLYGIVNNRAHSCRNGVVDFITDARFALPVEEMWQAARSRQGKDTKWYRYLFDEPNPWHKSSGAHHAVDLLYLFGGIDMSHNPHAEALGRMWRSTWIRFMAGEEPWSRDARYAFGPLGRCGELDVNADGHAAEMDFKARRRTRAFDLLKEMGWERYNKIFVKVAAGKVSLEDT